MKRDHYKSRFRADDFPSWVCSHCQSGTLQLVADSLAEFEGEASKQAHGHDTWEPDWIQGLFSARFQCSACKEPFLATGDYSVNMDQYWDHIEERLVQDCQSRFSPKMIVPNVQVFPFPPKSPEEVTVALSESFSLVFANPSAAGNLVRTAAEALLTVLKVKKSGTTNKGKRYPLNFTARLDLLPAKHKSIADLLSAIRWVGNAGSHSSEALETEDLLDSYVIFEEVLVFLYGSRTTAKELAAEINKKKKPRAKKKGITKRR